VSLGTLRNWEQKRVRRAKEPHPSPRSGAQMVRI
jgi:hypothetical protein